ncbi:MAG: hypothetical protein AAGI53_00870 [Planctomycetota bacterium]
MASGLLTVGLFIGGALALILLVMVSWWVGVRVIRFLGAAITHVFRFIGNMLSDTLRFIGAFIVSLVFVPLILANVVIGRWSASAHYGRALSSEGQTIAACLYRITLGHPARFLGLGHALEGIEGRLPNAIAHAPTSDKPRRATGLFDGYTIVGSLKGGGSGGKLYIAEPDPMKLAAFERRGFADCDRVVLKTFSLTDGSSLPQIVRESRALDAARKLGLVLEHELTDERFFYVMKYVPGESLATITQQLHAESAPVPQGGLDDAKLLVGIGYVTDLLESLETYHTGGLWHKDVKPDNIIIDPRETRDGARPGGRAHLVDFGLITPLRSAMTLTTHGTEYFRDPELVRKALRGVKVHQIDGAKFDVYAAGAVLYSVIEAQFPAHGGLSRVEKRCPDALRWVIRRAMTDYDKRYPTARAMLVDLEAVLRADDVFAVKPADLPSMRGGEPEAEVGSEAGVPLDPIEMPAPPSVAPAPARGAQAAGGEQAPNDGNEKRASDPRRIRVSNWWTGKIAHAGDPVKAAVPDERSARRPKRVARQRPANRAPAAEQLKNARSRVQARRQAAQDRISGRRRSRPSKDVGKGTGTAVGVVLVFVAIGAGVLTAFVGLPERQVTVTHSKAPEVIEHHPDLALAFDHDIAAFESDIEAQLAETEQVIKAAVDEAGEVARSSLEKALDQVRSIREALALTALDGIEPGPVDGVAAPVPAPPAPRSVGRGSPPSVDSPSKTPSRTARRGPPPTVGTMSLIRPGVRIAFLSDFQPPVKPSIRAGADGIIGLIEGVGADVFGDLTPTPDDVAQAGREITAIAEIRHARGRAPIDSEATQERVHEFVRADRDLDAILWIAPDRRDGRVLVLIATDRGYHYDETDSVHPGLIAKYALPSNN